MHGDLALANGSEIRSSSAVLRILISSGWLKAPSDDWKMEMLGAPPCSDVAMAPTFAPALNHGPKCKFARSPRAAPFFRPPLTCVLR